MVDVKIEVTDNSTVGKAEFAMIWDHILDKDWNEVIADDSIANIEITQQDASESQDTLGPEAASPTVSGINNIRTIIFISIIIVVLIVGIAYMIIVKDKKNK